MNPQQEVAKQVLCGYRMIRNFAQERDMLAELLGVDDHLTLPGWRGGVATIMTDLLTALHHYADKRALDWDEIVDWANGHHRIEAGVGRAWQLPDSALTIWVDWGNPYLRARADRRRQLASRHWRSISLTMSKMAITKASCARRCALQRSVLRRSCP